MPKTTINPDTNKKENIPEAESRILNCLKTKETTLSLSNLGLSRLPESLRALTWLQTLILPYNNLTHLPDWLGELSELRELHLRYTRLKTIPDSLCQLSKLQKLYISGGSASAAHETIGYLVNLQNLDIAHLELTQVPEWVSRLRKLKSLDLSGNRLTELPKWIGSLKLITSLNIRSNRLQTLPFSLKKLNLRSLDVTGNPDLRLPAEIVEHDDATKILNYYYHIAAPDAWLPLNEFKLILVGRGGVGKTTLVHRLVREDYKEFQRTPGISITKWPRKIDGEEVHAHIWDFGGQEIMHGTHRFFMTERALYLVLISGREGTEDHDAEYWLSMVRSFAGEVPVIVLLNKWEDFRFEINRELLREKYGRDIVFLETDSSTGYGIPALCDQICAYAKKLPGLKAAWPAAWRRVKNELPAQKESWLTFEDFRTFCQERLVDQPKEQELLAESLHDLGLMLSYRKEEALRSVGVLNPEWVTNGIYKMLNSQSLRDSSGRFSVKSFAEVLPENEYPLKLHSFLLALMRKFQLCHPLDNKGAQYLIPDLLTKQEPKLEADFPPEKCLGFIYLYDTVLPEGLLSRFIVETYVHQKPKFVWRTGVVLERANCRAFVRGDLQGRKVTIWVAGPSTGGRRELLGIIREYFERIHRSYEKLPITEMVPIPGHPNVHVKHELLLKYQWHGRETIPVDIDYDLVDFSVKELLDGVDLTNAPRINLKEAVQIFGGKAAGQLSLFISYSHKDDSYMDQLRAALVPYERTGELEVWADPLIEPGQKWEGEIFTNLDRAQIVVLLLSNDFMRSYFCMEKELKRAVERKAKGECEIVPVVVRACRFDKLDLGKIQAIIPGNRPIDEHKKKDPAWLDVTKQLDRVIDRLKKIRTRMERS